MTQSCTPKYVEEPGLIDEFVCSCGWKSGPYYDGAEFAYAAWRRHTSERTIRERQEKKA